MRRSNRRSVRRSNRRSVRRSKRGGNGKRLNKQITGGGDETILDKQSKRKQEAIKLLKAQLGEKINENLKEIDEYLTNIATSPTFKGKKWTVDEIIKFFTAAGTLEPDEAVKQAQGVIDMIIKLNKKGKSKDTNSDGSTLSSFNDSTEEEDNIEKAFEVMKQNRYENLLDQLNRPRTIPKPKKASWTDGPPPSKKEIEEYAEYLGMDVKNHSDLLWIAEKGLTAELPDGWKELHDKNGNIFFYDTVNDISQWEHPKDDYWREIYSKEKKNKLREIELAKAETEAANARAELEAAFAKAEEEAATAASNFKKKYEEALTEAKEAAAATEAAVAKAKEAEAATEAAVAKAVAETTVAKAKEAEAATEAATEAAVVKAVAEAVEEADAKTEAALEKAKAAENLVTNQAKEIERMKKIIAGQSRLTAIEEDPEGDAANMISEIVKDREEFQNIQTERGVEASQKVANRIRSKKEKLETTGVSREEAEEFAASQQTQLEPMTAARSLAPLETTQSRIAWGPQN